MLASEDVTINSITLPDQWVKTARKFNRGGYPQNASSADKVALNEWNLYGPFYDTTI